MKKRNQDLMILKRKAILTTESLIDLSDVPSQPLILKNELPQFDYKDNTRRRPVTSFSSKYTGVYFDSRVGKWKAQIMVAGAVRSIGYYEKEDEAAGDYARAAFKYKEIKEGRYGGLDLSCISEQPLVRSSNKSGYKGVKKMRSKWQANIVSRGKHITLGTFENAEEAARIYSRAEFYLKSNVKAYLLQKN